MRVIALIVLLSSTLTATPQIVFDDGKPLTKQRSPELEALSFMTGRWASEFTLHETPDSKEFKGKGVGITQWSPNGQFLIADGWALMPPPSGFTLKFWLNQLSVTTWDPMKKEYRVIWVLAGATNTLVMTMNRKGWTVQGEMRIENHVTTMVMNCERVSDTAWKVHTECSVDGGPKWLYYEGTAKKISD